MLELYLQFCSDFHRLIFGVLGTNGLNMAIIHGTLYDIIKLKYLTVDLSSQPKVD